MPNETPAPLSDAEIEEARQGVAGAQEEMRAYSPLASIKASQFNEVSHFDHLCANMYVFQVVPRLLATLAERDAEIRILHVERQQAALLIDARDGRLAALERECAAFRSRVMTDEINSDSTNNLIAETADNCERLERDNAAMREIVAAVAGRASTDARNVATNRRCRECGRVGPEPLDHEPDCLAVRAAVALGERTAPKGGR